MLSSNRPGPSRAAGPAVAQVELAEEPDAQPGSAHGSNLAEA
jgi:hypothetical protein